MQLLMNGVKKALLIIACALVPAIPLAADSANMGRLAEPLGGALAAQSSGDAVELRAELSRFDAEWRVQGPSYPQDMVGEVSAAREKVRHLLESPKAPGSAEVTGALKDLARIVNRWWESLYAPGAETGKQGGVAELIAAAARVRAAAQARDALATSEGFRALSTAWSAGEVYVRAADDAAYAKSELLLARLRLSVSAQPPRFEEALEELRTLAGVLEPMAQRGKAFGWLDTALLIFREGLEALLIIAALLAFLRKSNLGRQRAWVWGGAGAGLLASVLLAVALGAAFGGLLVGADSGTTRELMEGVVGLVAVALMLSVGVWLHNKASTSKWNASIKARVGSAVARGSFVGLAGVAFVAVLREGAETILFLTGLAASESGLEIAIGVAAGLAVLAVVAVLILAFSVKLPLHAFFLAATSLIYFLCVKILGESLAALQAANVLPAHDAAWLPRIEWLGVHPNWEALVPQLLLAAVLAVALFLGEAAHRRNKRAQVASAPPATPHAMP